MSSFYEFLGINSSATISEIDFSVQRRSLEINPLNISENDLVGPARSHWRVLQSARLALTDPARRLAYDSTLGTTPRISRETSDNFVTSATLQAPPPQRSPAASRNSSRSPSRPCSICGTTADRPQPFCLVCGSESGALEASLAAYAGQLSHPPFKPESSVGATVFRMIGWRKVRGTIVTAEAPYGVDNEFILWRFLVKVGTFVFLARVIYEWASQNMFAVLLGGALILLLAVLAAGIFSMLLGHFVGALFSAKLFGKEKQIQVRVDP